MFRCRTGLVFLFLVVGREERHRCSAENQRYSDKRHQERNFSLPHQSNMETLILVPLVKTAKDTKDTRTSGHSSRFLFSSPVLHSSAQTQSLRKLSRPFGALLIIAILFCSHQNLFCVLAAIQKFRPAAEINAS